ncbi:MAG: hypothetical protein M0P71_11660 [Melioribacteraceae bacterium]|nr:hypothetical protein [Melioribacteraceae bacterium]
MSTGEVKITDITGDVDASRMGGKVIQYNVKGKTGKSSGKEVNVSTMSGSLEIDEASNDAYLKTMSGEMEINKAGKFAEAETMGDDINIKE